MRWLRLVGDGPRGQGKAGGGLFGCGSEVVRVDLATDPSLAKRDHLRTWLDAFETHRAKDRFELALTIDHDTESTTDLPARQPLATDGPVRTRG